MGHKVIYDSRVNMFWREQKVLQIPEISRLIGANKSNQYLEAKQENASSFYFMLVHRPISKTCVWNFVEVDFHKHKLKSKYQISVMNLIWLLHKISRYQHVIFKDVTKRD